MEFHLTYQGRLLASTSGKRRTSHKHEIRQAFHPQLRRLWKTHPALNNRGYTQPKTEDQLAQPFKVGEYVFVPLVFKSLKVGCKLDILFLRPKGPLINSGDIDNRLKTLFDALKIPGSSEELGQSNKPRSDELPFYCLLEDDSLIDEISVRTGLLLEPVDNPSEMNSVRLLITVTTKPYVHTWDNIGF